MERRIRVFESWREVEAAQLEEWRRMTPQERLNLTLELHARYRESFGDAGQGLVRVARIIDHKRG